MARWNYKGDMSITEGGYFWRKDDQFDDYASIVEVIPDSHMGGADNVFRIFIGDVYIPEDSDKRKAALECCGYDYEPDEAPFHILVDAFMSYHGIECYQRHFVRIGNVDPLTCKTTIPEDFILQIRGNHKLENFIKRQFLN